MGERKRTAREFNGPSNSLRRAGSNSGLDRIDHALLAALAKNARLSNKELAARVGLAPSSALERFRRLERGGWLRGFHADIDPRAWGLGLEAMISVRLKQHSRDQYEEFRRYVQTLPEVVAAYHMAGADDFLVHVRVRDTEHLRDFAIDAFTTRPEVGHLETALIFEHLRGGATSGA